MDWRTPTSGDVEVRLKSEVVEESAALGDDLEGAGEEQDADDDEDNSHGDLDIAHGLAVFAQDGRHPADAEGGDQEWDGEPGSVKGKKRGSLDMLAAVDGEVQNCAEDGTDAGRPSRREETPHQRGGEVAEFWVWGFLNAGIVSEEGDVKDADHMQTEDDDHDPADLASQKRRS